MIRSLCILEAVSIGLALAGTASAGAPKPRSQFVHELRAKSDQAALKQLAKGGQAVSRDLDRIDAALGAGASSKKLAALGKTLNHDLGQFDQLASAPGSASSAPARSALLQATSNRVQQSLDRDSAAVSANPGLAGFVGPMSARLTTENQSIQTTIRTIDRQAATPTAPSAAVNVVQAVFGR